MVGRDSCCMYVLSNSRLKSITTDATFFCQATVLLAANMAYLATPFIESNNSGFWMSPGAILSQVSIILSLGCIIVGLMLGDCQFQITEYESAEDAIKFLGRRRNSRFGLEAMAIQYSLPYALLMWGYVSNKPVYASSSSTFFNILAWSRSSLPS